MLLGRLRLHRIVAPGTDAADDEPGGDLLLLRLRDECRVPGSRDLRVEDPAFRLPVPDGLRVLDRCPGVFGMAAIAARTEEFIGTVS